METETHKDERKLLERAIMFNDAVYAIALTLMVLEIKLPEFENTASIDMMGMQLQHMSPKFWAFLLSVVLVGGNWISSVRIQQTMVRAKYNTLGYLVGYLIFISLMPFCCNMVGSYPDNAYSFIVFGVVMQLMIVNAYFFVKHCIKEDLYHPKADMLEILKLQKIIPVMFLFICAVEASAFYNPKIAYALFLVYNLAPFVLTNSLRVKHEKE